MSDARDRWDRFLSIPIDKLAAGVMRESWIGRGFGSFKVVASLGAGGMGEVYRARDTRLGRDVAIKVLPPGFVADYERLERFEREARILAALNHPHIATIYSIEDVDEASVLVLELVEGETLAHRLLRGPVPVGEAMPIARQIAEALEAAHEKGIIHRDLKPANIALTSNGVVKVLDFGLAKASDATAADASESPTLTLTAEQDGVRLGTAPYMSPEQTRGQAVDKRTDIWAFGCVLFEMLTGRVAFGGKTSSDFIAAILERDPDWSALPTPTPAAVRRLLRRCLEKDLKVRLPDIAVARLEIDEPSDDLSSRTGSIPRSRLAMWAAPAQSSLSRRAALAIALVSFAVTGAGIGLLLGPRLASRAPAAPRPVAFAIALPVDEQLPRGHAFAISPDGARIAYAATRDGQTRLFLRSLDRPDRVELEGTSNATYPFFSPDGASVAFFAAGQLKRVTVTGGPPTTICAAPGDLGSYRGGTWAPDDRIIFVSGAETGLFSVPASGGTPQMLTQLDAAKGERSHRYPVVLPDGSTVLFTVSHASATEADIAALSLRSGTRHTVLPRGQFVQYLDAGYLIYVTVNGEMFAAPFDAAQLHVTGPAVPLLERPGKSGVTGDVAFALSAAGTLISAPFKPSTQSLVVADRDRSRRTLSVPPRSYRELKVSPNGRRLAAVINDGIIDRDIWFLDLGSDGSLTRVTTNRFSNSPVWAADNSTLTYAAYEGNLWKVLTRSIDSNNPPVERFTAQPTEPTLFRWMTDGSLAFTYNLPQQVAYSMTPGEKAHAIDPPATGSFARVLYGISPDGRWLAYHSNQSGQPEIFITSFPSGSITRQVSRNGGIEAVWGKTRTELFYRRLQSGRPTEIMSVVLGPDGSIGTPKMALTNYDFVSTYEVVGYQYPSYDVLPDGSFLMLKEASARSAQQIDVVVNWATSRGLTTGQR